MTETQDATDPIPTGNRTGPAAPAFWPAQPCPPWCGEVGRHHGFDAPNSRGQAGNDRAVVESAARWPGESAKVQELVTPRDWLIPGSVPGRPSGGAAAGPSGTTRTGRTGIEMKLPGRTVRTALLAGAALVAVVGSTAGACGAKGTGDAPVEPVSSQNNNPAHIINMPDGFPNVAFKCDGKVGIYVVSHAKTDVAPVIVQNDVRCGGGS
jgi:hypothetical protein